ncbi:MAG: tetraacyldisaccharide 4'-kinase [Gemmatimonadota bacterium]|nr:tetraacyldisaccharide 4'-kinase [Gemmatimonadota bacterium]
MADRLRGFVRDYWAGDRRGPGAQLLGAGLVPAEAAFRAAVAVRTAWYERARLPVPPVPVVSVGNLTVGGTGKTPVVRWLGDWFRERGARTAVVVRGYGRDEVALYRRWFGDGAVFVGADRNEGVRAAGACGCDLAVLDDGFQHRRVRRTLDILLVAAEDPVRVRLLPRGPYREPLAAARRATHVLVTRRTASRAAAAEWRERLSRIAPGNRVMGADMRMGGWRDLAGCPAAPPRGDVLAVCAVARPAAFAGGVAEMLPRARVELLAYPDHHDYTRRDVAELLARRGGRTIVCTAKDAVGLGAHPELSGLCLVAGFRVSLQPNASLSAALERLLPRAAGCGSR